MRKPFNYKGTWYPSKAAAARANGLKPNTLHKNPNAGKTKKGHPTPVRLNGIDFPSVKDAARYFGVHRTAITRTLNAGLNTYTPKGKALTIGREEYPSIKAAAQSLGVSRHEIYRRMEQGTLGELVKKKTRSDCMSCGGPITHGTHLCNLCRTKSSGLDSY